MFTCWASLALGEIASQVEDIDTSPELLTVEDQQQSAKDSPQVEDTSASPELLIVEDQQQLKVLDRYHRAVDGKHAQEYVVYALRNTMLKELLETREELKFFLGGLERARRVASDKGLAFTFDRRTCELYLKDCHPDSIDISAAVVEKRGKALVVKNPLYEIYQSISNLYTESIEFSPMLRSKLLHGLVQLAVVMSKLDRYQAFFRYDLWKSKLPDECSDSATGGILFQDTQASSCKRKIMAASKEIIASLQLLREELLSRYMILRIEVKYDSRSAPLYQLIYRQLEKVGFPSLKAPLQSDYSSGADVPWPRGFAADLRVAHQRLLHDEELRQRVFPKISNYVDLALLRALRANSKALAALGKDVHFHYGARHLLALTQNQSLWEKVRVDYGYLDPVIDFNAQFEHFRKYHQQEAIGAKKRGRYAAAVSLASGVVGLASAAKILPLIKKPARFAGIAWLVGGTVYAYDELVNYLRTVPSNDHVVNTFTGSSYDHFSWEEFQQAKRANSSSGYGVSLALLLIGVDLAYMHKLGMFDDVYVLVKDTSIAKFITNRRDTVKSSFRLQLNRGKEAVKTTWRGLRAGTITSTNRHINYALQVISKATGVPAKILDRTLYRFVDRQKLVEAIKLRTDNHYFRHLFNSSGTSLGYLTLMEFKHYGSDIRYNLDQVAVDYISSIFISVMLTWVNFGRQPTVFKGVFKNKHGDTVMSLKERAKVMHDLSFKSTSIGFAGTLPAVSMVELRKVSKGETTSRDAWRNILTMSVFGAVYIGTLSNIRSQFLREVRRSFGNREGLHFVLNNANSLFGQWIWIRLKDATNAYKRPDMKSDDEYYLVKGIKDNSESRMFDFIGGDMDEFSESLKYLDISNE
ncbi:MAG: hypothetical protein OYH77_05010 [Pseudomonadota bacterium]|nr:hypothetical protein [Pseudomonadota bacterium]